jgi:hypothetical protein
VGGPLVALQFHGTRFLFIYTAVHARDNFDMTINVLYNIINRMLILALVLILMLIKNIINNVNYKEEYENIILVSIVVNP